MPRPSRKPVLPRLSTSDVATRRSCVVLVDAHGPPYFATGHIPGAINIPPHDVTRLATQRLGDPRAPVVVYGSSWSSNAGIVAQQLSVLGYIDVSLYEDGLEGWIAAGLPVDALDDESGADGGAATPTQQTLKPGAPRWDHVTHRNVPPMTAEVLRYSAFTADGQGGNPAGVVLDAGGLDDGQMLAIAQAIGYSETAFVSPAPADPALPGPAIPVSARIRFFSPLAEVAFCGHATVATAVALAERNGPGRLRLCTSAGPVSVETRDEEGDLVATLTSPPTRTRPVDELVLNEALAALRWTDDDLDRRYPSHVAFAGNHHLVLGVRDRQTLAGLDYDFPRLARLMAHERWTTTHLFWSENATTFHVRNPFPPGGVVEDPATGAAAAAFGGYLRALGLVPVPGRLLLHQGQELGRPSRIVVDLDRGSDTVQVSGRATRLALSPYDEVDAS